MADKLDIYNDAIVLCGGELLDALDDDAKSRRLCDQFFPGVQKEALEGGAWKAFMRSINLAADPDINVEFGFSNGFTKPDDWRRTYVISSDPTMVMPLAEFNDEGPFLYANADPLYCRYVSDGEQYGGDLGLWSALFSHYVAALLAERICPSLTESEAKLDRISAQRERAERKAKSADAFREGPRQPPPGRWTSARGGSRMARTPNGYTYG